MRSASGRIRDRSPSVIPRGVDQFTVDRLPSRLQLTLASILSPTGHSPRTVQHSNGAGALTLPVQRATRGGIESVSRVSPGSGSGDPPAPLRATLPDVPAAGRVSCPTAGYSAHATRSDRGHSGPTRNACVPTGYRLDLRIHGQPFPVRLRGEPRTAGRNGASIRSPTASDPALSRAGLTRECRDPRPAGRDRRRTGAPGVPNSQLVVPQRLTGFGPAPIPGKVNGFVHL